MWSICGEAACVYKRHTIWLSNHSFKHTKYRRTPKPKSFVKQLLTKYILTSFSKQNKKMFQNVK